MKCSKCGQENKDKAKFCNQCGAKLMPLKLKWLQLSQVKKVIILLSVIILIVCIVGVKYYKNYQYETGYNLSYEDKKDNLESELIKGEYDKAKQLSSLYKVQDNRIDKIIQVYKENKDKVSSIDEAQSIIEKEEYAKACTVEKVEIKKEKLYIGYVDIEVTVKNNSSKDIKYIEVGLDFDKEGQTVKSDWINSVSIMKPNETQKLTLNMIDNKGWINVDAKVRRWNN